MASISTDRAGRRRILFKARNGKRKPIRLGKVSIKTAHTVRGHVEALITAQRLGADLPEKTKLWLAEIDDEMRAKLAAVDLIDDRPARLRLTLATFLDDYIAGRADVKPYTLANYQQARRLLVNYFGPDRLLTEITIGDAADFRRHLAAIGLGENTTRKRCAIAKMFFAYARDKGYVAESPFCKMRSTSVRSDREKFYFVTPAEIDRLLEHCPSDEWRLLVVLARYGGLRTPSESLALTWRDVNWAENRLRVPSPKTAHIEGREARVIPLFPELRKYLASAFDAAEPGATFVIGRTRNAGVNLRTQLLRILDRAGLKPWPRLWHNMRATRATELAQRHPAHVVADWLGHTPQVSAEFYLRTTDVDYAKALAWTADEAAQKAAQQPPETTRNASQSHGANEEDAREMRAFAKPCIPLLTGGVLPDGLEPSTL